MALNVQRWTHSHALSRIHHPCEIYPLMNSLCRSRSWSLHLVLPSSFQLVQALHSDIHHNLFWPLGPKPANLSVFIRPFVMEESRALYFSFDFDICTFFFFKEWKLFCSLKYPCLLNFIRKKKNITKIIKIVFQIEFPRMFCIGMQKNTTKREINLQL